MSDHELVTEARAVGRFDRIRLHGSAYGELSIAQGGEEAITVEAEPDVLRHIETEVVEGELRIRMGGAWWAQVMEALRTSIDRKVIRYRVTVRELRGLDLAGAARATMGTLNTDRLDLKLGGAGAIHIAALTAQALQVSLSGVGQIQVAGQVMEQEVALSGAGQYHAGRLESHRATVKLSGVGDAHVWATEDLDLNLSGTGSVSYYGAPRVKQKLSGLGRVSSLGEHAA
jgi:hypothetical protein